MNKFNPNKDMRIPMEKAHVSYRKPNKYKSIAAHEARLDGIMVEERPNEFVLVPGLQGGKKKPKNTKEKLFDIKNDGKPYPKKKINKTEKLSRAYHMIDGKKQFHEI